MKRTAGIVAALAISVSSVQESSADILFSFITGRDYIQTGPFAVDFRGGTLSARLRDGNALIAPCPGQPFPFIIFPSPGCPLGTTGFIAIGDADGDGIRDDLSFWSISDVFPAIAFEPFRPDKCQLAVGPPSDLPRPLEIFDDLSIVIYYNILTAFIRQYDITLYEFNRPYPAGQAGRDTMDEEVVLGNYTFTFPRLNDPNRVLPIQIAYGPIPDPIGNSGLYPDQGFRFTLGKWEGGFRLMDPRVINRIGWTGIDATNTRATDEYRLSIRDVADEDVLRFPLDETTLLIDPNLDAEVLLSLSDVLIDQEYLLPPYFFNIGETGILRLRLDRTSATSNVAYDQSVRLFNHPVRFVDSYAGFRQESFPVDTTDNPVSLATRDFDGDGISNVDEWGQQTDPTDAGSVPVPPAAMDVGGFVEFTFTKRPDSVANYVFQVSTDGGLTYKTIKAGDPLWVITTNDATTLTITTNAPANPADFVSRIKVTEVVLP